MIKLNNTQLGFLGECTVMSELAKIGIFSQKLDSNFDFDILTDAGERVEVKSSTPIWSKSGNSGTHKTKKDYFHRSYQFTNAFTLKKYNRIEGYRAISSRRDRQCDFFILICFELDYKVNRFYVIPKEVIGMKSVINVPYIRKRPPRSKIDLRPYVNNWGLLKIFNKKAGIVPMRKQPPIKS